MLKLFIIGYTFGFTVIFVAQSIIYGPIPW